MLGTDNREKSGNNYLSVIQGLIAFLIIVVFCFFLKGTFLIGEDYDQLFFSYHNFMNMYGATDHGCFLSILCMKIIGSYIPLMFGVHPNSNFLGIFMRALDYSLLIFLISRFATISTNYKKFNVWYYALAAVIFIAYYLAYAPYLDVFQTMFVYNRHYRYIFTMIIYLIFWLSFFKFFISDEVPKGKHFIFLIIIGFCAGIAVESVNISTFFSLILFFIFKTIFSLKGYDYNFLKFLYSRMKDKWTYINGLKYLIIISSFITGAILLFTSPVFLMLAKRRGISTFSEVMKNTLKIFPEFSMDWFYAVFINQYHWVLTAGILILSILILFLSQNRLKNAKVIIFAWILVSGIALFNFSLILSGKTYCNTSYFWFMSQSLNIDTLIVLLTSFFILLGYYCNELDAIRNGSLILNLLKIITVIAGIFAIYFSVTTKQDYFLYNKNKLINARQQMYRAEKMYVFYAEKNETAILPASLLEENIMRQEVLGIGNYATRVAPFLAPYYISIYKKKLYVPITLLPDDKAMKEFNSRGGVFYDNEIEESNFSKLLDKDFVLDQKSDKK